MIVFICGCESKIDPPIDREVFKTFDSVVEDHEGHLICIVHKERLKGWRSVPYTAATMPRGLHTASWTPLEWERWKIFGEMPRTRKYEMKSTVPDRRDARDPEQVGNEYLAAMAVGHNGNIIQHEEQEQLRMDWPR